MRIAQTILDLLKAIMRGGDSAGQEDIQSDGWLLEGDKIGGTSGVSLMGDPQDVLRHRMSLDSAIYTDRALSEAGGLALLQMIENASLSDQSHSPF